MEDIKEKTADEMFEELGYIKIKDTEIEVQYNYSAMIMGDICTHTILIAKKSKLIFSRFNDESKESMGIGMKELQAINKKCKELKWI